MPPKAAYVYWSNDRLLAFFWIFGVEGPVALREQLAVLALSNDAVWARERSRKEVKAPWVTKAPYFLLCLMLDTIFDGRPIARFWFLETVARMPYFSYLSCFHLFESLGE